MVSICPILWCWDLEQRSPVISFRNSYSRRARGAVSYTHLDVYKRQPLITLIRLNQIAALPGDIQCVKCGKQIDTSLPKMLATLKEFHQK